MSLTKTYLNILPLESDKIDIFSVYNRMQPQVSKWVDMLLGQAHWEIDIHTEYNFADLFRHFYAESKNVQKTHGQHTFGFGFPLVIDTTTEGGRIKAPLFIWYLNIKPHPTRKDSWLIAFEEGAAVAVNEYFLHHLSTKYGWELLEPMAQFAHKRPITRAAFETFIKDLCDKLLFDNSAWKLASLPAPRECPTDKELQEIQRDIVMAGVLGIFPHQEGSLKEKSTQDIDFQNFTWTAEHAHEFSVLPDDVYQREALRTVLRNKITVIEGAHGTGKTYLAANILLNALSNGQKTAAIAEDIPTLMQIQNEFVKLGVGNLTFLLQDVYFDKKLLLDVLRSEQNNKAVKFDEDEFNLALKQARRLLSKSDDSHEALSQPIFGNSNFSEIVGRYLASQKVQGRELLANHLNSNDYEFSEKEYEFLKENIAECEKLFKSVNTLKHPLSQLSPSLFSENGSSKGKSVAIEKLGTFIDQWKAMHHRYIAINDAYSQKLMHHYENFYNELRAQLRHLKEAYSDFQFQFGQDFEDNSFLRMSGLRAASIFSDRSKNVLTAKEEAVNAYDELAKIHAKQKYFPHEFLKDSDKRDFKKLKTNLETFELSLKGWRKALSSTIHEELQRLNSKTAGYLDKKIAADIKKLEEELEEHLKDVNEAGLYAAPISHKMLTLPKRMSFIEETIEKLEETQLNMRDFDTFYNWQRFWLNLPDNGKKTMQALIKVKPQSWVTAFDSWYFYNLLIAHYQSNTIGNDELMNQMNEAEDKLRTLLPAQIRKLWNERKLNAIKELKAKFTEGYRLFFNVKNQELAKGKYLKQVLKNTIGTLSEIYPVLLITPQVASQLVEGEGKEFDLMIFDNAENIDSEKVVPLLRNTEGVVIMAENSKRDDSPAHSLIAQVKKYDAASLRLNHLHRSLSETVRRINQTVFYPDLDIPFRQMPREQSVKVIHVKNGHYSEKSQTNDVELAEIVRVLEDIHATPYNTYPKVGVVTMNKKQRNTLVSNLLHIVQKSLMGWEKIEQLQRNGLGIYSIEEIAGMQFDILVVSGTTHELAQLNFSIPQFRRLLNSFTQKIIWLNSIPKEQIEVATTQSRPETAFLLSNLLLLAEDIERGQTSQSEVIFENLKAVYGKPAVKQESLFVKEVVETLSHFIEKKYINTNFTIENQVFPIVILPKYDDQMPIIVRIDGKLSHSRGFNPSWERRILMDLKMPVVSIWSYNWWRNPKDEAFHLAQAVFAYDKQFVKVETPVEETEMTDVVNVVEN